MVPLTSFNSHGVNIMSKTNTRENRDVFQNIIDDYETARPGYPADLYRDIVKYAGLHEGAKILEIGAGPGQATDYFVRNHFDITALEITEKQTRYLNQKFADFRNFHGICAKFEDFDSAEGVFDLIFSATAFHWIDPEVGYPKAHRLLKSGGVIAVFWHLASIIEPETDMLCNMRDIVRRYAPQLDDYISREEGEVMHSRRMEQMQAEGWFQNPVAKVYRWNDAYSTERYLKLMNSYSDFHAISEETRQAIRKETEDYINRNGGIVTIPQEVRLYMARK